MEDLLNNQVNSGLRRKIYSDYLVRFTPKRSVTFKETTKASTPNIAYHPSDHTFAEMSFQLYTVVSWIFTILTLLTNGIRSLVTSLLKRNTLPDPYSLPVHTFSFSDSNCDSITSFSCLCLLDHTAPQDHYINKHLRSQILVRAGNILFQVYLFVINIFHSTLDNFTWDCKEHIKGHQNCPKND